MRFPYYLFYEIKGFNGNEAMKNPFSKYINTWQYFQVLLFIVCFGVIWEVKSDSGKQR